MNPLSQQYVIMSELLGFSVFEAQEKNFQNDLKPGLIYLLTSPNGKVYIGQTTKTFAIRMAAHKSSAKTGKGGCRHLINAINEHGWDNFKKEVLMRCNARDLDYYEKKFVALYDALNRDVGYNIVDGGNSNKTYTDEQKQRMSDGIRKNKTYDLPMGVREIKDDKKGKHGFRVKIPGSDRKAENFVAKNHSMEKKLELAMVCYNTLKAGFPYEKVIMRKHIDDEGLPKEIQTRHNKDDTIDYKVIAPDPKNSKWFQKTTQNNEERKAAALAYHASIYNN
jgi:group I intron endonuclease